MGTIIRINGSAIAYYGLSVELPYFSTCYLENYKELYVSVLEHYDEEGKM